MKQIIAMMFLFGLTAFAVSEGRDLQACIYSAASMIVLAMPREKSK